MGGEERAYLAGIIDGEGSISLTVNQKGGSRIVAVTVSNNDLNLLLYVKEIIGAGQITNKNSRKKEHAHSYTYAIYSRQAIDLLKQVLPYLRTYKRKRAALILDKYLLVTPRNGKYTPEMKKNKQKFVDTFFAIAV